jgi:hypothetical protein
MSQGRGIVEEHIGFSSQFQNKIGFQSCVNLHTYVYVWEPILTQTLYSI